MQIAICLYGQPRDYNYGYNLINNFMKINNDNTYDIFFHCWIDDNIIFDHSPWRKVDIKTLIIQNQNEIKNEILQLYKPTSYEYEKPLDKNNDKLLTDLEYIKSSLAYHNMLYNKLKCNNIYNTLSQIYSRNKVKDIFEKYIINTDSKYDMVISTRFDGFDFPINLKLSNIQKNKIYVSSCHRPRYILPDNFLIIPIHIYLNWFNLYKNIKNIINNKEIEEKINNINERLEFNIEEYLLANYLYYGYDIRDVLFINYSIKNDIN